MHTVGCPRSCLGFTNIFFFILGLIGCVICVWCSMNTDFFKSVNYTITKSSMVPTVADFVNLRLWSVPLTAILIPVGFITMLTSCCGVISAGCQTKCALKSYVILVTLITSVVFWIIFVSCFYNIYTKNENTRIYLKKNLQERYGQEDDFMTFLLNYLMVQYECCGVDSQQDFVYSKWRTSHSNQSFPIHCCKLANKTRLYPKYEDCPFDSVSYAYAHRRGCFDTLHIVVRKNKIRIISYALLVFILYATVLLMTYVILNGKPLIESLNLKPKVGRFGAEPAIPTAPMESIASLDNMLFVDEPSTKVVRVVSAVNPAQMYKFADGRSSVNWGGNGAYAGSRGLV